MSFPIDRVRTETSGCFEVIHLNNAGCALAPQVVVDSQIEYLRLEATVGGYEAQGRCAAELDGFYDSAAVLVGANRDEIALTRGAFEAWWRAFTSVGLEPGDRVLVSEHEFVSGGLDLAQAKRRGVSVEFVPSDESGVIDLEALESLLDERVKLVCLTYLPMSNGLVNPAQEVGRLAKSVGALYLLDACQGVGQMPIDVEELQCDFLTATGRKWLRSLRGTGFLYVRGSMMDQLVDPIFVDGASAHWTSPLTYELVPSARRFELAEISYAGKLGLAKGIDYALELGLDQIRDRISILAAKLRSDLVGIDRLAVLDAGETKSGIVTFNVGGIEASEVAKACSDAGINVGAPTKDASLLDMSRTSVASLVRASPHYYNTEDELDTLCGVVTDLISIVNR